MLLRLAVAVLATLLAPGFARAFLIEDHEKLTDTAMAKRSEVSPNGTGLEFSPARRDLLPAAVGNVDLWYPAEATDHFDNEALRETSEAIQTWTSDAVSCLTKDTVAQYDACNQRLVLALIAFNIPLEITLPFLHIARSLHAVQDFYSHSNFVSLWGPDLTLKDAYGWKLGTQLLPNPLPTDQFCDVDNPGRLSNLPLVDQLTGILKLTTGYFDMDDAGVESTCFPLCDKFPCFPCKRSTVVPSGKCQHGYGSPEWTGYDSPVGTIGCSTCGDGCRGINKDKPPEQSAALSCVEFPSWHDQDEHEDAYSAAVLATDEYLVQLIQKIAAKNPVGVCRLFGLDDSDCEGTTASSTSTSTTSSTSTSSTTSTTTSSTTSLPTATSTTSTTLDGTIMPCSNPSSCVPCPSGTCVSLTWCQPDVLCVSTIEGSTACVNLNGPIGPCDGVGCSASANCQAGEVCIINSCCPHGVCAQRFE